MSPNPSKASFGQTPQDQPAPQAAPATKSGDAQLTRALAERHEALWLAVTALHKDIITLGAKKPDAPVSGPVRIAAESLLSDCAPFIRKPKDRLPVAVGDLAGLAVQLGQALAGLGAWESQRSFIDTRFDCRMWRVQNGQQPIMRLKPPAAALPPPPRDIADLRDKLQRRFEGQRAGDFQRGFAAGRAARDGRALADIEAEHQKTYPRLRLLD